MTVGQMLREMDSVELTMWQQFLSADAEHQDRRRKSAQFERAVLGDET